MNEDYEDLTYLLSKKKITYNEFNELLGNYFVEDYEELEDNYYLIKVIRPNNCGDRTYIDYIEVVN